MPTYFVTGATGLVGRHIVERLARRGGRLHVLVRPESAERDAALLSELRSIATAAGGTLRVQFGDVTEPSLGLDDEARRDLTAAGLDHVFHVAGHYDLEGDPDRLEAVNVGGTRELLTFLVDIGFEGVLHHVSSAAVAGSHAGEMAEDTLDVGQSFEVPYFRTKHDAEALVRAATELRVRVYRPSAVVGDSRTGETTRADGPYFLFPVVRKLRDALPRWVSLPELRGAAINMVPVDFVADAIVHLAHTDGFDGRCFHVVDPRPPRLKETFNLIADAAGAPRMKKTLLNRVGRAIPGGGHMLSNLGTARFLRAQALADLGIPLAASGAIHPDLTYATDNLRAGLDGSGIRIPKQAEYVEALWDYWLRHLDPKLDLDGRLRSFLRGKRVLVTGGSSGIGAALAEEAAAAGAHVVVVARRERELAAVCAAIRERGGAADFYVADLSDYGECDRVVDRTLAEHGPVDVLVNNAGRSIRRPLAESLARFHDLERVMAINFFAPARLIRGFLPAMRERGGRIVNVLSAGARMPAPRFGVYATSKAALAQLGDTLNAEHAHEDVLVTSAFLSWVRTPMVDDKYGDNPSLTPREAARWILEGVVDRKPHVIEPRVARRFAAALFAPRTASRLMNVLYRVYGDDPSAHPELELDRSLAKRFIKGRPL